MSRFQSWTMNISERFVTGRTRHHARRLQELTDLAMADWPDASFPGGY
jgi:hypothetical protein